MAASTLAINVEILGEFKKLTKATKGASRTLTSFQKHSQKVSRNISRAFSSIGTGLSFYAVAKGIKSMTQAAIEDQQSMALLAKQMINTNGASKAMIASAEDTISSLQASTNIVDDKLRPAFAKLYAVTGDVELSQRLLSDATDLAAAKGVSLEVATKAISKAYAGNTGQLIKLAPELKNSSDWMTDLEKSTNGAAAAAANLDPYTKMKVALDNAKETIGTAFLPALDSIATWINDNLPKIDGLAKAINVKIVAAFDNAGNAAFNFGAKISKAFDDITNLLSGNVDQNNPFFQFFDPIFKLAEGVVSVFKGVITVLDGFFYGLFGWLELFGIKLGSVHDFLNGFAAALKFVGEVLQNVGWWIGFIASFFVPFGAELTTSKTILQGFSKVLGGLIKPLENIGKGFAKWVSNDFVAVWSKGLGTFAKTTDDFFKQFFGKIGQWFATKFLPSSWAFDMVKILKAPFLALRDFLINNPWIAQVLGMQRSFFSGVVKAEKNKNTSKPYDDKGENRRFAQIKKNLKKSNKKIKELYDKNPTPTTGLTASQKKANVKTNAKLDIIKQIKDIGLAWRDAIDLSFGVVTNDAFAVFDINRFKIKLQQMKNSVKNFARDIGILRAQATSASDQSLIEEIMGMDPTSGAAVAASLALGNNFRDIADSFASIENSGIATGYSAFGASVPLAPVNNNYTINVSNANKMTAAEIVSAIKAEERRLKRKLFV